MFSPDNFLSECNRLLERAKMNQDADDYCFVLIHLWHFPISSDRQVCIDKIGFFLFFNFKCCCL